MPLNQRRGLGRDRALPCDVVRLAKHVPSARAEMSMNLQQVAMARRSTPERISWASIFLKAQAQVAAEFPVLRQACMRFPFLHIHQHLRNVAMISIERENGGTRRLYWARFIEPETMTLAGLQASLDRYKTGPVEQVYRKQRRMSVLPTWLRRILWYGAMNLSGRVRERQVGTFSISTLAGQGVVNRDHPSILTSSLTYGPLDDDGNCLVTLIYDHRLLDGMDASRILQRLRQVLHHEIVSELRHSLRKVA